MKKFLSISFSLLILLSGMHFTVATHYCGGKIAASKVSFSGGLASCGMENPVGQCPSTGTHLASDCCHNKVSAFVVDNNYAPSFSEFKAFSQPSLQIFNIPASLNAQSLSVLNFLNTNVHPPGNYLVSEVRLPDICVFRI
jgi:hypothetical protein